MKKVIVSKEMIVHGGLWKMFPCIEVGKTKNIPCDYPGPMGVPISAMDKIQFDKRFEIIDLIKPKIGDKELYRRVVIRNLFPDIPDTVDINKMLEQSGSDYMLDVEGGET